MAPPVERIPGGRYAQFGIPISALCVGCALRSSQLPRDYQFDVAFVRCCMPGLLARGRLTLLKITGLLLGAAGVALIVRYPLPTQSHVWVGSARVTRLSHLLRPFRDLRQEVGSLNEADYAGRSEPACDRYAAFSSRAPAPPPGTVTLSVAMNILAWPFYAPQWDICYSTACWPTWDPPGSDGHLPDTGLRHALQCPLPVRDSHSGNDGRMRPHCYGHRARDQEGLELCSLSVNRSVPGELRLCRSLSRPRIHRIHLCGAH